MSKIKLNRIQSDKVAYCVVALEFFFKINVNDLSNNITKVYTSIAQELYYTIKNKFTKQYTPQVLTIELKYHQAYVLQLAFIEYQKHHTDENSIYAVNVIEILKNILSPQL